MHLVGFIIRIYHNARSPERQMLYVILCDVCYRIVFYCTVCIVMYCPVFLCNRLPLGMTTFAVNNNNNNNVLTIVLLNC